MPMNQKQNNKIIYLDDKKWNVRISKDKKVQHTYI